MSLATLRDDLRALIAKVEAELAETPPPAPPVLPPNAGQLAWGGKVSSVFRDRVRWIGDDLNFDPNWLMACMAFETGRTFSASIRNPGSSATGLIQFMNATAAELGTTTAALAAMTAEDQLNYVWRYFHNRIKAKGPIGNLGDCYAAILNPIAMGKPDSYVMWDSGDAAYRVNAGLDKDSNGHITKAEATSKIYAMLSEGLRPENTA